jgi:hypothetical protein
MVLTPLRGRLGLAMGLTMRVKLRETIYIDEPFGALHRFDAGAVFKVSDTTKDGYWLVDPVEHIDFFVDASKVEPLEKENGVS